MPGMGLLNDGYKPNSWDNKSAKEKQAPVNAPSYNGVGLNSGPIDLAPRADEGFALLHCGGTAVKIGFTNMRQICTLLSIGSRDFGGSPEVDKILKAFAGVACETSVGNLPLTSTYSEQQLKVAEEKLARIKSAYVALEEAVRS